MKCFNCNKREATEKWGGEGSIMDVLHGEWQWWCLYCCVKAQLKYAKKQVKRIPILERKLAKLKD